MSVPRAKLPSIMFAVTEDWYFWSHRKPLAGFLAHAGCKIAVATRFNRFEARLRALGFDCLAIPFERSLRHPLRDLRAVFRLWRAIRMTRPDVVHLVSLKPILLSALALTLERRTHFAAAFTGMGYLFSSSDRRARWFRRALVMMLRVVLRRERVWVIVQNEDDRALLLREGLADAARTVLIPGVGVDTDEYAVQPEPTGPEPVVLLPARLIRDKGIEEFVVAARDIRRTRPEVRFVLVGADDPDNPAAIAREEIAAWIAEGVIESWGHRDDMPAVYATANLVCLPSYREGLPKVLIEAASCGRALIATDVAGCREVCRNGITGILIPPRSPDALAEAIRTLLDAPARRRAYGGAGRRLVETHYSLECIGQQTLACYERMLGYTHD